MIGANAFFSDDLLISVSAFLISLILTPLIRRRCQQRHMLDFPTSPRKIHVKPIPRLGGIAIYLAFFLPLFASLLTDGAISEVFSRQLDTLLSLFATSTLIFAIGVYDDIRGATVMQKLTVQFVAATLIYFLGFKVQMLAVPFIGPVSLGFWELPVTLLWIVGVTNALNFIDGVDGLACGVGFFSISTMFMLALFLQNAVIPFFAAALAGGLLGFAWYNFAPASIFMGDSGSLFVGFMIATISLQGAQKSSTAVVLLIPIVALGVPIADTLLAIIRRLGNGYSPFMADKEHIHHRLLRMGLSSRQVTLVLYAVCCLLGITALLMTAVNNQVLTLILLILTVMTIGGMKMLGYTTDMIKINHLAKERIQHRKRLFERQRCADEIIAEIRASTNIAILQKELLRYFENMEFDVGKFLTNRDGTEFTWYSPRYTEQSITPDQVWTMSFPLIVSNEKYGELLVGKYWDAASSLFETIIGVETLKQAIEESLAQIPQMSYFAAGQRGCDMG